jgi:hypothetical protein
MKPQHILMLKKVGKGLKGRVFYPGQARSMDMRQGDRHATKEEIDTRNMNQLEKKMEGMGMKKAIPKSVDPPKRKPLKFKL